MSIIPPIKINLEQMGEQTTPPSQKQVKKIINYIKNQFITNENKKKGEMLLKKYKSMSGINTNTKQFINTYFTSLPANGSVVMNNSANGSSPSTTSPSSVSSSFSPSTANLPLNTPSNSSTANLPLNTPSNSSPANGAKVTVMYQGKTSEFTVIPNKTQNGGKRKSHKKHHKKSHTRRHMRKKSH